MGLFIKSWAEKFAARFLENSSRVRDPSVHTDGTPGRFINPARGYCVRQSVANKRLRGELLLL